MNDFSYKQELFKNYLLKKVGFGDDSFSSQYSKLLEIVRPRLKLLGKQKKVWSEKENEYLPEKVDPYKRYIDKGNRK
jgi:hypothetical protein